MNSDADVRRLSRDDVFSAAASWRGPEATDYYAMYSSVFGGIVTNPSLMLVPLDEHMVHRGDGVFEAFKCVDGSIYNLEAHLQRLQRSAAGISLALPGALDWIRRVIVHTVKAGNRRDCNIRLFVSRGVGTFDCNPKECRGSSLYVIALKPWQGPARLSTEGVNAVSVDVPVKPGMYARVKSCNYLPNVMVHMQANKAGADFGVVLDEEKNIAEGATENIAVVTANNEFIYPSFARALRGTSLLRGIELAARLVEEGLLRGVGQRGVSQEQAYGAKEMLVFGTGPNVLPIVRYDNKTIGEGKPGPVFRRLSSLFDEEIHRRSELLTTVW